jgi:transposase
MLAALVPAVQGAQLHVDEIVGTTQLQHENSVSIAPWFAIVRALKQETTGRNLLCDTP